MEYITIKLVEEKIMGLIEYFLILHTQKENLFLKFSHDYFNNYF
jgi:hypothetical protein